MTRLLTLIVLAAVIWLLWRRLSESAATAKRRRATRVEADPVKMVPCDHCGLHVPVDEALRDGDRRYCSRGHLEQAQRP